MFEKDEFERIVVRIPNWVGDVVMATPALRAIRDKWPRAEITAFTLPAGEKVLRGSPRIDRFEIYDRHGRDGGLFGRGRAIRRLKAHGYDLGILLPNSISSAWLFWRAKIPRRLGADLGGRKKLLTDRYVPEDGGPRVTPAPTVGFFADILGVLDVPRPGPRPELFETEEGRAEAEEMLGHLGVDPEDRLVGFSPGASFGESKVWPAERHAAVADHLQEKYGLKPLLLGGPGEEGLLIDVERHMRTPAINTSEDLLDLDALKTAVRRLELLVASDAGPRHYGVAFGVPVVVIFGSTDPRYSAANLERTAALRVEDLDCSPCHQPVCPLRHRRCTEWIETDQVIAACERWLDPAGRNPAG